ncbi:MAG: hypothetical protein BWY93_01314 [Euryarchaeota archaeon ADurb.BinA087]|nr:MAG: hypothetical protein BWY93_01314 [Euryarchaeota archaeon ADurb.BinA087]
MPSPIRTGNAPITAMFSPTPARPISPSAVTSPIPTSRTGMNRYRT